MSAQYFVVIEQRISVGNNWNGTVPLTAPDYTGVGIKKFPVAVQGGLFEFDFTEYFLMEIQQINVDFGGAGTKSIVIRSPGAPDIEIFSSTDPLERNLLLTCKFQLASDEKVAIISSGGAAAEMFARIIGRPLHPIPASMLP